MISKYWTNIEEKADKYEKKDVTRGGEYQEWGFPEKKWFFWSWSLLLSSFLASGLGEQTIEHTREGENIANIANIACNDIFSSETRTAVAVKWRSKA